MARAAQDSMYFFSNSGARLVLPSASQLPLVRFVGDTWPDAGVYSVANVSVHFDGIINSVRLASRCNSTSLDWYSFVQPRNPCNLEIHAEACLGILKAL